MDNPCWPAARGEVDFAQRHGVAGHTVDQAHDVHALVAQGFAQHIVQEQAQIAATLADQTEDECVGFAMVGEHAEQDRLADAGFGKDPEPLAAPAWRERG